MNTENLNGILAQYIQHCKSRTAADEGTIWRAVDCFGVNWDIDDSDFPVMFGDAMQQAKQALDNPALQPVGGLQELMLRDAEVELVRECFRWLFKEDDGDISKRRGRAELFADRINGRFRRVFPRLSKYTMNAANALFFLNLWEPHDNYFYHAAEAKAWAEYFDYEADFGGGTALDLPRYYTMCNDLLRELENYPELIALHKAYAAQELGGIEDSLHLLVYDILHTAYTEQFYPKGYARSATTKERAKAVKEKNTRAELCIRIGECEQTLQELLASPAELPDLTGRKNILELHAKSVKTQPPIDLTAIARATPGASGADLANIINEGALRAVREGRKRATQDDFEESVEVVIAGQQRKSTVLSDHEKQVVSYHEIGHAIVAARQKGSAPVTKITIVPRTSGALGYTMQVEEDERFLTTRQEVLD